MTDPRVAAILAAAEAQVAKERFDAAVAVEVVRLRTHRTWLQRLRALIPTITWKKP